MARYFPEPVPYTDELPYIREWLGREFGNILAAFEEVELIQLTEDHVDPVPRDGMIKLADGTNWDPGQGAGFYGYRAGGWHKLDLGGSGVDPNLVVPVNFVSSAGVRYVQIANDSNGAIEIGKVDGNTSTPLIDFHTSATPTDYNVRLIASGTSSVNGSGQLDLHADGGLNLINGRVNFPAAQNPSTGANVLDDYEEGTWTPTITFAGGNGDLNVVYSSQIGRYQKVGRIVHVHLALQTSTFTHTTAAGELRIPTLPFASVNTHQQCGVLEMGGGITLPGGRTQVGINIGAGVSYLRIIAQGSNLGRTAIQAADMASGSTIVLFAEITYEV